MGNISSMDALKGAQGPLGPVGPAGPKGDTGLQGPQGIQGLKGDMGPQGPPGIQGLKGDTGIQGPVGNIADSASVKQTLLPLTMWCADGELCNLPALKTGIALQNSNIIQFGQGYNREANAGKIGYGTFDGGASGSLNIVGAGTGNNRRVRVWDTFQIGDWTVNANDGHLRFFYQGNQKYVMHNTGEFWSANEQWFKDMVKYQQTLRIRDRRDNSYLSASDVWNASRSTNRDVWERWFIDRE
jgi:hypothetical protein